MKWLHSQEKHTKNLIDWKHTKRVLYQLPSRTYKMQQARGWISLGNNFGLRSFYLHNVSSTIFYFSICSQVFLHLSAIILADFFLMPFLLFIFPLNKNLYSCDLFHCIFFFLLLQNVYHRIAAWDNCAYLFELFFLAFFILLTPNMTFFIHSFISFSF